MALNNDGLFKYCEDSYVEWIEEVNLGIPPISNAHINKEYRIHSSFSRRWKDIDWNILVVVRPYVENTIGIFLGFDDSSNLQLPWSKHISFHFEFLDDDGKMFLASHSIRKLFQCSVQQSERIDCGNFHEFNYGDTFRTAKQVNKFFPMFRIKVCIEEFFSPASVPLNYDSKTTTGMVGLENLGATCYLNALLQMLFHVNSFRKAVYKLPHHEEVFNTSTTLALQSVFRNLQCSVKEVTTKDLTTAFGWTSAESFMQQDVQEMMRVLIDKLEAKTTGTVVDGFIKKQFSGIIRSFIKCEHVEFVSQREEDFYDIQLDVKGCKNVYDSFDRYIASELLDGENQYFAEGFGKQDAKKGVIFTKLPPVLTIHLKRFDFDVNTMGFTKIHDYYAFPDLLELDKYVTPDSPCQSREFSNRYVLHSVLVHSGDVGGGHYYAYIRPSSSYDYTQHFISNVDNQWFKFNDETVLHVQAREAFEACFGCKTDTAYKGCTSSAYMLVYIRLSDASDIMSEVLDDDIPAELVSRLDAEMRGRMEKEWIEQRSAMFIDIPYVLEDDLRSFTQYSKTQDLVSLVHNSRHIRVMQNSKRINVLLRIAHTIGKCPLNIRLWKVEKWLKGSNTLRICSDVDIDQLREKMDTHDFFFVQIIDLLNDSSVSQKWNTLQSNIDDWLQRARTFISKDFCYGTSVEMDDHANGCGVGSSNLLLRRALNKDFGVYSEMKKDVEELTNEMLGLYAITPGILADDSVLVFFKVFDPFNVLLSQVPVSKYVDVSSSIVSDTPLDSLVTEKLSIGSDSDFISEHFLEYLPMKYVGFVELKNNSSMLTVLKSFQALMLSSFSNIPEYWMHDDLYRVFHCWTPQKLFLVTPYRDGSPVILNDLWENLNTYLLVIDIPDLLEQSGLKYGKSDLKNFLPYGGRSPIDWLSYRAYRRHFLIMPLHERDAQIVSQFAVHSLKPSDVICTGEIKSDPDSTAFVTKKRFSEDNLSNIKRVPTMRFKQFLPLSLHLKDVFNLISSVIGLDQSNVILYLVQKSWDKELQEESVNDILPVTCVTFSSCTLSDLILKFKYQDKQNSQYMIYYQISPFGFLDKGITSKRFEFFITDARVRRWRKAYFSYIQSNVNSTECIDLANESIGCDLKRRRVTPWLMESIEKNSNCFLSQAKWNCETNVTYDILELNKVRIQAKSSTTFGQLTFLIRKTVGIPTNIDELGEQEDSLENFGDENLSQEFMHNLSSDVDAVCTDSLKFLGGLTPNFPLMITVIRHGIISEIYSSSIAVGNSVISWMDATVLRHNLYLAAVQHVNLSDMIFMQSKHPVINSMIVSVFSFTLLGNVVVPCEVDQFSGPFVTYVREDDDLDTFSLRLRRVTEDSDEDWMKCRLAIVKSKVPYFLKKKIRSTISNIESKEMLWDSFVAKYPEFSNRNSRITLRQIRSLDNSQWYYPQLGIQRSVSDIVKNKRIGTKAIKIV